MKTKSTSLFIAVAAFAVTASGVHAFSSPELLVRAGLSDEQVVAVQEAQELKASGELLAAKEALKAAGVTKETMRQIKAVAKEAKQAVKDAVQAGDYAAFKIAIADSPLEELITTKDEFNQFVAAHALRQPGEARVVGELFTGLGIGQGDYHPKRYLHHLINRQEVREQLTQEQRAALQVAHQANDKDAVRAIFAEAGIELPVKGKRVQ